VAPYGEGFGAAEGGVRVGEVGHDEAEEGEGVVGCVWRVKGGGGSGRRESGAGGRCDEGAGWGRGFGRV